MAGGKDAFACRSRLCGHWITNPVNARWYCIGFALEVVGLSADKLEAGCG
jgi:hypothetical protein